MDTAVINELEAIRQANNGLLRPEDVVTRAEDELNPLHRMFDWDDTSAGHKYRLQQARMIIRVAVTVIKPDSESPTRSYVSLVEDRHSKNGYRATVEVLEDPELRERLLQQALKEMLVFRRKYQEFTELAEVFDAMDSLLEPVDIVATA